MEENDRAVLRGAILLAVVLAGGAAIYRFASAPPPLIPRSSPGLPLSAEPAGADLPRLEESDAWIRNRAAALSADPRFAEWLKPDDLAPRAAAAANMIARGKVPADALAFLAPKSKFSVVRRRGRVFMDPGGWARYDGLAGAFASIDAAAAARFFRSAEPLFQSAWESLGERGGRAEDVFLRAAGELIAAPAPGPDAELKERPKGVGWAYADPALEALSPAQKQLLRMGPKNAAAIQFKLREIARALGASDAALAPAARAK